LSEEYFIESSKLARYEVQISSTTAPSAMARNTHLA